MILKIAVLMLLVIALLAVVTGPASQKPRLREDDLREVALTATAASDKGIAAWETAWFHSRKKKQGNLTPEEAKSVEAAVAKAFYDASALGAAMQKKSWEHGLDSPARKIWDLALMRMIAGLPARFGLLIDAIDEDLVGAEYDAAVRECAIEFDVEVYLGTSHKDGHSWPFYNSAYGTCAQPNPLLLLCDPYNCARDGCVCMCVSTCMLRVGRCASRVLVHLGVFV